MGYDAELSMAFSDVKKFFLRWRKELVGSAVLVGLASAVLFILWQLGLVTFVGQVTLVQIITALFVLVGLYWTSRRVLAAEENVRVAQEGQITERFTRAIEQLGHKEMAIRLGGIYALERIAKDSGKDHGPIMEVLTAYVRERAPRQGEDTQEAAETLPTDIQAILTVISRRETTGNNRRNDPLDLTHTQLVGAALDGASLRRADLRRADLRKTCLDGADLREARLTGARLREATLLGADLREARLIRADLREARLTGAALGGARLIGAALGGARLVGARLVGAALFEADLHEADLSKADLHAAGLHGANLRKADLREAENLTAEQVKSAKNWHEAHLPDYLNLPKPPAV